MWGKVVSNRQVSILGCHHLPLTLNCICICIHVLSIYTSVYLQKKSPGLLRDIRDLSKAPHVLVLFFTATQMANICTFALLYLIEKFEHATPSLCCKLRALLIIQTFLQLLLDSDFSYNLAAKVWFWLTASMPKRGLDGKYDFSAFFSSARLISHSFSAS